MRIITISGAKNTKKDIVAFKLAQNSDCVWVHPYTDFEYPVNLEDYEQDQYTHLNEKKLSRKMERETPLAVSEVNGHRYVFFENQLTAGFCVLIADDRIVTYLKKNWEGELVTVKCHSKNESYSERCLLNDDEFDIIFNTDDGDYDELSELVGNIFITAGD